MSHPVTILLIDDHPMVAESLANALSGFSDLEVKGALTESSDALNFLDNNPVEVVVMDIQMQGQDGIAASVVIRKKMPAVKILFLSLLEDAVTIRAALAAGSSGYITKRSTIQELRDAILTVAAGRKYFSEQIVKSLANAAEPDGNRNTPQWIEGVSVRELEIAGLIAQGLTTEEIADKIYLSVNTVESYRGKLIKKLGVKNSAELAAWAVKNGVA